MILGISRRMPGHEIARTGAPVEAFLRQVSQTLLSEVGFERSR